MFLNESRLVLLSISWPQTCSITFLYRDRSILDSFSSSVSIVALLKLLTLTFSFKNLVTTGLKIRDPVMKVRSGLAVRLVCCVWLGEFCSDRLLSLTNISSVATNGHQ